MQCKEHIDLAMSCGKILQMHDDIIKIREDLTELITKHYTLESHLKVQDEKLDNIKLTIGAVITIEIAIIIAIVIKFLGAN